MGVSKRNPWLYGLGVLLAVLVVYAGQVRADVTSDKPGSIVIYPKVIADGTRDTLIQLTNTSNMGTSAHCWYFDASPCGNPDPDIAALCCQPNDFFVDLTPQQPIFWRASTGRSTSETRCNSGVDKYKLCATANDCSVGVACEATPGIFLGLVPRRDNFRGELKCIQVNVAGEPVGANSLKGEALLETLADGQVSEYNAIAIQATANPLLQGTCVGGPNAGLNCTGPGSTDCCNQANLCGTCSQQLKLDNSFYNACPTDLFLLHYAQGAQDLFTNATVSSEITLVPCTEDIANPTFGQGAPLTGEFLVTDEQEFETSQGFGFTCWLNQSLENIGVYSATNVGTFVKTRIVRNSNTPNIGLLGIYEEFHTLGTGPVGTAAANFHITGSRSAGDVITLPPN